MRDEILEIGHAIAMTAISEFERVHQRVLAAETDAGEMRLAAGLAALAPADDDGSDIEEVTQREVERRDQQTRAAFADHGAVGVDVERRQAVCYRTLFGSVPRPGVDALPACRESSVRRDRRHRESANAGAWPHPPRSTKSVAAADSRDSRAPSAARTHENTIELDAHAPTAFSGVCGTRM